ncbi:probably inactive receptor-like protein kinase At2g46850 [Solanum lycopersicum]|uniref:Protein kinase domain-containing protein n=1 Tax=Solanum lycopersicum TaxID=4081 RepID=K4CX47_SOLLC|nr:probably inactive receptor-like protein kinase At2g46850 [Solanum lycopersicum]
MLSVHSNFPFILVQFYFTILFITAHSFSHEAFCGEKCGDFHIPFPFYMNQSICNSSLSDDFRLSCINSTSPFLNIGSQSYRILHFFSDGVLVDFPNTTYCRQYNDLKSFGFNGNDYFGIARDNILGLYDCEDSSLCKPDCEKSIMPHCDGSPGRNSYPPCCYPLSDRSAWSADQRDGFSVFSQFGCRGFSSWVDISGNQIGKRGVKLEWAVPGNSTTATCAANADSINATTVASGIRCECQDGYVGDGFAVGVGCLKSCIKEGKEAYGKACYSTSHGRRKTKILAGVVTSALTITSLTALFCVLRRPMKTDIFDHPSMRRSQGNVSFQKPCTIRMFTYHELEQATKGFQDAQILIDHGGGKATLYSGALMDGSRIAVHRLQCDSERELVEVLSRVEALHAVSHKNIPHILGWSVDSGYTPLVVYEYPVNGTLGEHLFQTKDETKRGLDWHHRTNIVAETANVLAFLQSEICPPIVHHELNASCIFLDEDMTVKLFGLELPTNDKKHSDVYNLGLVLLEVITGSSSDHVPSKTALQKITSGKVEEIVDPRLYYHEQPILRREQIEIVADLATRCIIFGCQNGKFHMGDVSRELVHITKDGIDGRSRRCPSTNNLEETFSNSSLLQMISMSPDSIHVPAARGFS